MNHYDKILYGHIWNSIITLVKCNIVEYDVIKHNITQYYLLQTNTKQTTMTRYFNLIYSNPYACYGVLVRD